LVVAAGRGAIRWSTWWIRLRRGGVFAWAEGRMEPGLGSAVGHDSIWDEALQRLARVGDLVSV
jgi:hypothetical protein